MEQTGISEGRQGEVGWWEETNQRTCGHICITHGHTIGWRRPGAGSRVRLEEVHGGSKGTWAIFSTIWYCPVTISFTLAWRQMTPFPLCQHLFLTCFAWSGDMIEGYTLSKVSQGFRLHLLGHPIIIYVLLLKLLLLEYVNYGCAYRKCYSYSG